MSHTAARAKDLGRMSAPTTRVANTATTAPSHTLLRLLKTVLCRHSRRDPEVTLVTVVTKCVVQEKHELDLGRGVHQTLTCW